MAGASIQSYAYSEGPAALLVSPWTAAPAGAPYQSAQTLAVVEQSTPATTTYARPASPLLWTDLLAYWSTSLSAHAPAGAPSGHYSVTYSATTRRVTIANTAGAAFRPVFVGSGAKFLGFTQYISGWDTSWTALSAPLGVVELVGATVKPAEDGAKVQLAHYRHGRAVAVGWGNTNVHHVTVWIRRSDAAHLSAGWCLTGRVRLWQHATHTDAYSATNVAGYVDGYVVNASALRATGASEDFLTMDLTIATAR